MYIKIIFELIYRNEYEEKLEPRIVQMYHASRTSQNLLPDKIRFFIGADI